IDFPFHDYCAALALLAAFTARAFQSSRSALSGQGYALPVRAGTLSWHVASGDVAAAVIRNDIERFIVGDHIAVGAPHAPRLRIAASGGEANPMITTRDLRGVTQRLVGRAVVGNDLRFIGDAVGLPELGDRQLARRAWGT